ncbi:MAG: ABC transporter ATP-binding protein [Hyphomonadaceae bacterium]
MNADPAPTHAISLENVAFGWRRDQDVLRIDGFSTERGERVFLRGASGSGKSTLLSLISGVTKPREGRVRVLGRDIGSLSSAQRDAFRADRMGVVFQMFNLVPYLTVLDNVVLPLRFSADRRQRAEAGEGSPSAEARRLLARLGLEGDVIAHRRATELSVGQQQRVAVARALIGAPDIILADEPTSALDADARNAFIALLLQECSKFGSTLLFVSHDVTLARNFDRAVDLADINTARQRQEVA